MPSKELITEKLLVMKKRLKELELIRPSDFETYLQNLTTRYAVERLIQIIVDLALDINNIILSGKGKPAAVDYFNSFMDLVACQVLEDDFARQIAPSTGLRDRLAHEYEEIDHTIVFESINKTLDVYSRYVREIKRVLRD